MKKVEDKMEKSLIDYGRDTLFYPVLGRYQDIGDLIVCLGYYTPSPVRPVTSENAGIYREDK